MNVDPQTLSTIIILCLLAYQQWKIYEISRISKNMHAFIKYIYDLQFMNIKRKSMILRELINSPITPFNMKSLYQELYKELGEDD